MRTEEKRPEGVLLLPVDYTNRLAADDSIINSSWNVGATLDTEDDGIIGTHHTYALISGGDALTYHTLQNIIDSANGERIIVEIPLFVKNHEAVKL